MPDTATDRYGARKQALGANVNTWGETKLNDVLDLFDRGSKGYQAIALAGDLILSWANYATTNQGQVQTLKLTGSLAAPATVTVPSREWSFTVINAAGAAVTVKTAAGTGVAIPAGHQVALVCDGVNVINAAATVLGGAAQIAGALQVAGKVSGLSLGTATADAVTKGQLDNAIAGVTTAGDGSIKAESTATARRFLGAAGSAALQAGGALVVQTRQVGGDAYVEAKLRATQAVPITANATLAVGSVNAIDTSAGAIADLNLPATGLDGGPLEDGDMVQVIDVGGALSANACTLDGNGHNIKFRGLAAAATLTLDVDYASFRFIYDLSATQWMGV
ncbi:MAG: hypothetical protein SFV21_17715 [Rhodospirillaceae bacterium]|nr:hypothetical protein [Rhodospirillaceae bacterium]